MDTAGAYQPSPVAWVREEVELIERTGVAVGGRRVVLLGTVGARSGALRKTPLMRVELGGVYAAVASMAGAQRHPAWYANVLAHPVVQLRDGDEVSERVAREVTGAERARWWSLACTVFPSYVTYQSRTRRRIPVLLLERPAGGRERPAGGPGTAP
ncbi:nitroreductase family deazaflavin-dependent oxidoreductase [Modestobacter sp. I12A-02628]|uniref:Nitroreductase family deazaflavin-dependent oxidoreductase n=1 Tax=Goekera deserti TaxID=2497753 RepID=A0A7K3WKY2_9ACTN|nr:nitroreductase family deazaflavin-dependent oxidoreductase [Goekera deserti]MPQ97069.1 nitroreductase family deazaflavin-dependent oxidoreductase [Goekera deserti]NDI46614.1 nitroreductase family deazaflavin-dependent oxidoreductase [Goekera deserti]NEL56370.1 nitroreductase family deazaflavin-dependent oxidoreductase [Goekera deserti]